MGFLSRFLQPSASAPPSPIDDYWYTPLGQASVSGVAVDSSMALKTSAVYACVRLLSETVASLPAIVYRTRPDGGKERATDYPIYSLLHDQPNATQTAFEFICMLTGHAVLRGNGYARILPGPKGPIGQLVPMNPDRVDMKPAVGGGYFYRYQELNGTYTDYNAEDIFHLRGFSDDGIRGLSMVNQARDSIGLAIAQEHFGASYFKNGAEPGGILKLPGRIDDDQVERLRKSWNYKHGGIGGAHKIAILEQGLEWQSLGMSNKDSEFIAGRTFSVNDIARWFRVPPHMIGDLSRATFSNIEQQGMDFLLYTLLPWLKRWEQAIQRDLIIEPPGTYFVEFLVDALMRGDTKTRFEAYMIGRQGGWLCVNDILRAENRNPIEGGDVYNANLPGIAGPGATPSGATPEPMKQDPPVNQETPPGDEDQARRLAEQLARDAAARVVRKERAAIDRALGRDGAKNAIADFYRTHEAFVAVALNIDPVSASDYCTARLGYALNGEPSDEWATSYLVELMLGAINA